jgi:hypothetical protein
MIATCAVDRSVRLWTYDSKHGTFKMKLSQTLSEEPISVAIHPSGFHILVCTPENVKMMNILDSSLVSYKELGIKNCKEIQFSNGGQYFACQAGSNVIVYKFYTAESPPEFNFKGH